MKWLKRFFVIFMIFNVLGLTFYQQQANANVVTKPLAITAKKVAKDLAKDSAVAMAEDIVSKYLVRELIEGANVDSGYAPVCMDGAKDNIKDCPPDKRAQVKKDLTSSDRSKLASTVETVLEGKTNTSAKWQKFLDFFIPIFLISGLVATFDAMLDGDSESFIDEVAQQALIDAGLLKSLTVAGGGGPSQWNPKDFTGIVQSASVSVDSSIFSPEVNLDLQTMPGREMIIHHNGVTKKVSGAVTLKMRTVVQFAYVDGTNQKQSFAQVKLGTFRDGYANYNTGSPIIFRGEPRDHNESAQNAEAKAWAVNWLGANWVAPTNGLNDILNTWFSMLNVYVPIQIEVPDLTVPPVKTDYGTQTGLNKTKNPDGTKTLPGVQSFTYTYNNTHVYPSTDSTTGWKDKTTGKDITVVPDDVVVDGGPTDPEAPPKEESEFVCDQKMKLPDFKPVSKAFTNAFPFSIPWDIKRAIDAAFGGVGDSKPEFKLSMFGPNVSVTIPDYIDNWMPFVRGFLILFFDLSVLYMFYRFMKGGGD